MEILYFAVFIIVVILLVYIVIYNKFVRLNNNIKEASSGIDIALVKRFDLISNLVNTVKGYSEHEKSLLESITLARNNLESNRAASDAALDSAVERLNVVIESYPELKASAQFLNLQKNLTNVEEHLSASRRLYNRSVTNYNDLRLSFPASIIANAHKFQAFDLFRVDEKAREKPTLDLN